MRFALIVNFISEARFFRRWIDVRYVFEVAQQYFLIHCTYAYYIHNGQTLCFVSEKCHVNTNYKSRRIIYDANFRFSR